MSGKAAIKGIGRSDEYLISFNKDPNGNYIKRTKRLTRDHATNAVKHYKKGNPVVEEGPFVLVKGSDAYDDKMEFEDFNGNKTLLYFKKIKCTEE